MTVLRAKIGGQFQSVLSGYASNVFVGPDPPTDPNIEFWIDTDATLPVVPWTPITTFQNGWVAFSNPPYQDPQYRKIGDIVYVRGTIKNPTPPSGGPASQTAFVLPTGFRPPNSQFLPTLYSGTDGWGGLGRMNVLTSGNVDLVYSSNLVFGPAWVVINMQFSIMA